MCSFLRVGFSLQAVASISQPRFTPLSEPSMHSYHTPSRAGNLVLNRFCIDEDAACELSVVYYLLETSLNPIPRASWQEERDVDG